MDGYQKLANLAECYYSSPDLSMETKRTLIGLALSFPELDKFISDHTEGWNGVTGQFARVLARMVPFIE